MAITQKVIEIEQIIYKISNVEFSSASFPFYTFFSKFTHKKVISYYVHFYFNFECQFPYLSIDNKLQF